MFSLWKRHGIYFRNLYLENTSAERLYWPPQGFWWKQPILGIGRQSVNSGRLCQFGSTVSIRVKWVCGAVIRNPTISWIWVDSRSRRIKLKQRVEIESQLSASQSPSDLHHPHGLHQHHEAQQHRPDCYLAQQGLPGTCDRTIGARPIIWHDGHARRNLSAELRRRHRLVQPAKHSPGAGPTGGPPQRAGRRRATFRSCCIRWTTRCESSW